jgi:hypothetical protein
MRIVVVACSLLVAVGSGCAHKKPKSSPGTYSSVPGVPDMPSSPAPQSAPARTQTRAPAPTPTNQQLIVTPENSLVGKVKTVNETGRFVILSFPIGRLPGPEQQFSVYRRGLKVAEIRTTNQQQNEYVVADIIEGDAEEGDEVRNK